MQNPLHLAASNGDVELVKKLLAEGANDNGETALHVASREGRVEVVRMLLDGGADPNMGDEDGWTPLHEAAYHNHAAVCALLVLRGAESVPNRLGWTPLQLVLRWAEVAAADALLRVLGMPDVIGEGWCENNRALLQEAVGRAGGEEAVTERWHQWVSEHKGRTIKAIR